MNVPVRRLLRRGRPGAESIARTPHRLAARRRGERLFFGLLRLVNCLIPKSDGKVVLHSIPFLEDGTRSVIDELVSTEWRPVVLVDGELPATPLPDVWLVRKRSLRGVWHFLTSTYVFTTHGLFGNCEPPKGQQVVNLWHGEPPVKVMGRYEGQQDQRASVVPVLSTLGQAYRCTEFGLHPRRVPILGAPRNDQMLRTDRIQARKALLGPNAHLQTYLWMPTFRAMRSGKHERVDTTSRFPGAPFSGGDLKVLDHWLWERDMRIVIKLHPLDADQFEGHFCALTVLRDLNLAAVGLSVYRSLPAFDGLITDASSVWIDYLLLNRPVIVAFPDVDDYRSARGLNMEPYEDWVPGPFVKTVSELTDVLAQLAGGKDAWAGVRHRAARQLHCHHDAGATRRLLTHIGILP